MQAVRRHPLAVVALALVAALALVLAASVLRPDPVEAQQPGTRHYESLGQINSAQSDTAWVPGLGCRYDTSPVSVTDGDLNAVRCAQTGELLVSPASGSTTDVNLIEVVGTAANVNGGNRDAGTQTVTLADDDPAVTDLAAIEVLATDIETNTDYGGVVGGGVEATALRVTLADNSTGLLSVDDNGGALSIDVGGQAPQLDDTDKLAVSLYGTDVAAGDTALNVDAAGDVQVDVLSSALPTGAATEATLGSIQTAVETLDNIVSGSEAQVDVVTEPATVADGGALPAVAKVVAGYDGANVQALATDTDGQAQVDVLSSALPAGAATQSTLADVETNTDYGAVVGGGAEATALRVTLASDSTGLLSVDDNGASITVDTAGGALDCSAATVTVSDDGSFTLAANSGVDIGDVDVTSVVPGTGATDLGKAIDSPLGATDTGVAPLAVRDDALSGLTPVEGDYVPLYVDANGALWVTPDGTVTVTDDGSFTLAANSGVDIGDVDVLSSALPTGAATEATLATIDADTSTLAGAVAGTEVQVDVLTMPADATELPAAAALSDDAANPTTPTVGAAALLWDGATWDRWPGDSSDGGRVELYSAGSAIGTTANPLGARPPATSTTYGEAEAQVSAGAVEVIGASVVCDGVGACSITLREVFDTDCDSGNGSQVNHLAVGAATSSTGLANFSEPFAAAALCVDQAANVASWTVVTR